MRSNKHLRIFPIDSGRMKSCFCGNICTIPCHIFSFYLLFRRQTMHTAQRHTSEQHVQRCVKRNYGQLDNLSIRSFLARGKG